MPASMNVVWLINLFIIKKETYAAGFTTSKSLCLPQIGSYAVPKHHTTIALSSLYFSKDK